jgi:GWxTD domain-containing protein
MHFRNSIEVIFIVLITAINIFAKEEKPAKYNESSDTPFFYYEASAFPLETRDSVRIEITIKVPFDAIQFIKKDTSFVAQYEISITLLDESDAKVASRIWTQELSTQSYDETNSQDLFDVNKVTYNVRPSNLMLVIGVLDLDTKKSTYRKKTIDTSKFYTEKITLSNINIVEKEFQNENGTLDQVASVEGTVSDSKPHFNVVFDVLSEGGKGTIKYSVANMDKKVLFTETINDTFCNGITKKKLAIDRSQLGFAKYQLRIKVKIGRNEANEQRIFQLRWIGMSKLIDDLDLAVDQMRYIANPGVIKDIKNSKDPQKKEKFIKFWKEKDPSPNTDTNELMNEYYKRVQYSNEHFSGFLEGWKTDMGMIFILFGPPNDIERHPFEIQSKPYEIWYYYEINRTFVFIDESGFGDYRLITPYYEYMNQSF